MLNTTGSHGETVLHWAMGSIECLKTVLSLYPESQRLEALNKQNRARWTVLKLVNEETRNIIMEWLSKSESSVQKRSHASALQDEGVDVDQREAKRQKSQ